VVIAVSKLILITTQVNAEVNELLFYWLKWKKKPLNYLPALPAQPVSARYNRFSAYTSVN